MEMEKFYLTKQGLERIKKEYQKLKNFRLAKTKGETPKPLSSEKVNFEYLALKEDSILLDSKIIELENILKKAIPIKPSLKKERNIIKIGATILAEIDGQEDEFTLVGTLESNPSMGKISNESLVGKALLGHKIGDKVTINSAIKTVYKIKKIKYEKI